MAVVTQKEYSSTQGRLAIEDQGVTGKTIQNVVSIASGDSATSKYVLGRVSALGIPVIGRAKLYTSGVAGVTDADVGLYVEELDGTLTVKDVDIFVDGEDLSSAVTPTSGVDGFKALAIGNVNSQIIDLASDKAGEYQNYLVVLTINQDASGAGTVGYTAEFAYGA